jgi:hypothetical protein
LKKKYFLLVFKSLSEKSRKIEYFPKKREKMQKSKKKYIEKTIIFPKNEKKCKNRRKNEEKYIRKKIKALKKYIK